MHEKRPDDAERAARAAVEIHAGLRALGPDETAGHPVGVAIGIDWGEVVCGNVGHEQRLEFALVGDTVNVAARIQGLARSGETLVTARLAEKIGDGFDVRVLEETMVKGRAQPVEVCSLTRSAVDPLLTSI